MADLHQNGAATLFGYIGKKNTGDDAFLAVSALALDHYLKPSRIYALANQIPYSFGIPVKPVYLPFECRGVRFVNDPLAGRAVRASNHVVFAGGSIFHTADSLKRTISLLKQKRTGLAFAVGVSIGPFSDPEAPSLCARLLSGLDFVGVRDKISYERGKELYPQANIHLTFDLAPLLPFFTVFRPEPRTKERRLGISICNYERFKGGDLRLEKERIVRVAEAVRLSIEKETINGISLLDFNGHPVMGDHEVHSSLKALIGNKVPFTHLAYSDNPMDFMKEISTLNGMLSMRLHANIYSFCTQTPNLMLAYHEKCREWAETIGLPEQAIFDSQAIDPTTLSAAIDSMLECPETIKPKRLTFEDSASRSLENWAWIPKHFDSQGRR